MCEASKRTTKFAASITSDHSERRQRRVPTNSSTCGLKSDTCAPQKFSLTLPGAVRYFSVFVVLLGGGGRGWSVRNICLPSQHSFVLTMHVLRYVDSQVIADKIVI